MKRLLTGRLPLLFRQFALPVRGDDFHPDEQVGKVGMLSLCIEKLVEGRVVDHLQTIFEGQALGTKEQVSAQTWSG